MIRQTLLALGILPMLALAAGPTPDAAPAAAPTVAVQAAGAPSPESIAARLNALAPLFRVSVPTLPDAPMPKAGDDCAVELASVALLYRNDPDRWRNRFFELLVIDDYLARSRKQYNLIGGEDVAQVVDSAFAANPGVVGRMRSTVAFCQIRRTQPFVMTRKAGMIALSRVVRAMMMGDLLEGVEQDTLQIANAMDRHTASKYPGLEMPWEKPLE